MRGKNYFYISLAKSEGIQINLSLMKEMYNLYKDYLDFYFIDLPLLLIPNQLCYTAAKLYRYLRSFIREIKLQNAAKS
jgi:hypothetical protein